jgi:serine/threonine-protein kinase RsbW
MELLRLSLAPRADEVAMVRQAISGVGEALGLSPRLLSDVKLATSEACTNAIVHAYEDPEQDGASLVVLASSSSDALIVTVQDAGRGIAPRIDGSGLGLGLPLIAALSRSVAIREAPRGGTEVEMTFGLFEDPTQ